MNGLLGTDDLQRLAWDAEDDGRDVYVAWFNDELIERIEIDGVEIFNDLIDDELDDWMGDAERFWRE